MPFVTRKTIVTLAFLAGVAVLALAGFVWSGVYNVGADDHHWRPTHTVLEALRKRSIEARASKLQVPSDLASPERIRQGAGNYAAMCTGCHLAPGMQETEMSKGLYPVPPDLTRYAVGAAEAFWVIKHGIKASGMPAWGMSMEDEYIWNMAAFLQELPKLNAQQYEALVASSDGHSHGGGETEPHEHGPGTPAHDDKAMPPANDESKPHTHAPGTPPHDDAPKAKTPVADTKPYAHASGTPPHDHSAKPVPAEPAAKPPAESAPARETHGEHDHEH